MPIQSLSISFLGSTRKHRASRQVALVHRYVLMVFFFQAEDGIRDLTVTGVQTCALPIYAPLTHVTLGRFIGERGTTVDQRVLEDRSSQRYGCEKVSNYERILDFAGASAHVDRKSVV